MNASKQRTAPTATERPHIRWMIRRDLPSVLAIEGACFEWDAWSEEDFIKVLRQRNCIGMVAEQSDRVVGYMLYEMFRDRINVLNFAVAPSIHRSGVGASLVEKLKGKLSEQRRNRITLDIRDDNLPGQLFFKAMGFRAIGSIEDAWDGVDAYRMEYRHAD